MSFSFDKVTKRNQLNATWQKEAEKYLLGVQIYTYHLTLSDYSIRNESIETNSFPVFERILKLRFVCSHPGSPHIKQIFKLAKDALMTL